MPSDVKSAQLIRHLPATEHLVVEATRALPTFYEEGPNRFFRDTLDDASNTFSTGGSAVSAELGHLDRHFGYLTGFIEATDIESLRACRDASNGSLSDPKSDINLESIFGASNHYSLAVAAQQALAFDKNSPRARLLGAFALRGFADGWPTLQHVDEPHPFVAWAIWRAAKMAQGTARPPSTAKAQELLKEANVQGMADGSAALLVARGAGPSGFAAARNLYLDQTSSYLWRQVGHASNESHILPSHDPAGSCLALQLLIDLSFDLSDDKNRDLTKYEEVIQRTLKHVLSTISLHGSFPYGAPFGYSPKGMGAFATSISGLAALVQSLYELFASSRKHSYSNGEFLRSLVTENLDELLHLLSLTGTIRASVREVDGRRGWCSDRAPSSVRIESWVTADVLSFSIGSRLLCQEISQFLVAESYGASIVEAEPEWPYEPGHRIPRAATHGPQLIDPDQGSPWDTRAPVQALHQGFEKFMGEDEEDWKSEKSAMLLFGPPGTAKSTLAKSLAQKLRWHFIELTPSNFIAQGLELVERRSQEIFEELGVLRETVVLFDELDSLLTDRELLPPGSILNFSVPALLPKLQRLAKTAKKQRVLLLFATNFFDRLDPAMVRRGRIDDRLVVLPPNASARRSILSTALDSVPADAVDNTVLAVHEDLQRFIDETNSKIEPSQPIAGLAPTLYLSRLPREGDRRARLRSTERLAVEVAEVLGRLIGESRVVSADASGHELIHRLEILKPKLNDDGWRKLCDDLVDALNA